MLRPGNDIVNELSNNARFVYFGKDVCMIKSKPMIKIDDHLHHSFRFMSFVDSLLVVVTQKKIKINKKKIFKSRQPPPLAIAIADE